MCALRQESIPGAADPCGRIPLLALLRARTLMLAPGLHVQGVVQKDALRAFKPGASVCACNEALLWRPLVSG